MPQVNPDTHAVGKLDASAPKIGLGERVDSGRVALGLTQTDLPAPVLKEVHQPTSSKNGDAPTPETIDYLSSRWHRSGHLAHGVTTRTVLRVRLCCTR